MPCWQHLHRQGSGPQGRGLILALWSRTSKAPQQVAGPPVMAVDTVRYVGDRRHVVANSHDEAQAAAEAINVDYYVKVGEASICQALDKGAVEVIRCGPGNLVYDWDESA